MKEIIIKKGEVIEVFVYERGDLIDRFKLKLNCNNVPYRVNDWKNENKGILSGNLCIGNSGAISN